MLDELRAWLNGTRDYYLGISIYNELGDNEDLKALFFKGKTDYCNKRLQRELLAICNHLKSTLDGNPNDAKTTTTATQEGAAEKKKPGNRPNKPDQAAADSSPAVKKAADNANPELYTACKLEADRVYKEAMNARAVLFSMIPSEQYQDPNKPDLVYGRAEYALKVVKDYNHASALYDRADYVKLHGKLPEASPADDEIEQVPDHLVKSKLDNLRKNLNKIKTREQTPERVALMQKHQADIETLEAKWLSLKPKK